jgi:uncharacterized protein involved in exopolysaccharide biosynthesis
VDAQAKLRNFQEANGSEYFGKDPGGNAARVLAFQRTELENLEGQLQGEQASLNNTLMQLEKVSPISSMDMSKQRSPEWKAQSLKIETLASQVAILSQDFEDTWPKLKAAKAMLEEEKRKLELIDPWQTDTIQQGMNPQWSGLMNAKTQSETTIAMLKSKIDGLRKNIERNEKEAKLIPEKVAQANALQDAVFAAESMFAKASKTRDIAKATRDRVTSKTKTFFRVVVETTPEEAKFSEPVYPNYLLFAGLGAFIGLLLGGGFAFISEFAAASFSTPNQVRYSLQIPVLGEIAPLMTYVETRSRKRRRLRLAAVALILVAIVTIIHVMWFDKGWRAGLPPFLRDVMRRLYGVG